MPTYVYECRDCAKTIEVEQRVSDEPLKDCDCGAQGSLRRLIQRTAVLFKGSGFHINDYSGKAADIAAPNAVPEAAATPKTEPCGPSCACTDAE